MEFNPPGIEKSDQIVWSSASDDHHEQVSGHVRTYTCSFCKRGFSNAQALGGHMNIHRKDRAKLKELSGDEISKKSSASDVEHSSQFDSSEEKSGSPTRPLIFSKEDGDVSRGKVGVEVTKQLSLFDETPSTSDNLEKRSHVSDDRVEKTKQIIHGSSHPELDLELRLGLEHHDSS